jgi:hypothetical protein
MTDRALPKEERAAARDSAVAEHKAAVEAQATEAPEFMDAGYEDTLPGQVEVVAGTVEHVQVLNSFANATSYGPDVNVVVPAPEEPPVEPPPEEPPAADAERSGWQR